MSGLAYQWLGMRLKWAGATGPCSSIVVITTFRNRFVKVWYSEPVQDKTSGIPTELPSKLKEMLSVLDGLFADALRAVKVDVYAIRNPTNALQALRAKWRGVEPRISMWKMPDYTRKFLEIDGTQQWWEKDKKNRYYPFQRHA